jgi:hypothetical protein
MLIQNPETYTGQYVKNRSVEIVAIFSKVSILEFPNPGLALLQID